MPITFLDEEEKTEGITFLDPVGDLPTANRIMNDGVMANASPEQREAVDAVLSPQDMEFETAKAYYDAKYGTNNSPVMIEEHIKYEYGEDATPQVANQMNKKAAKHAESRGKGIGKRLLSGVETAFAGSFEGLIRGIKGTADDMAKENMREYNILAEKGKQDSWRAKAFKGLADWHTEVSDEAAMEAAKVGEWRGKNRAKLVSERNGFIEKVAEGVGQLARTPLALTPMAPFIIGGAMYQEGYDEALANGASEDEANDRAQKYTLIATPIEYVSDLIILEAKAIKGLRGLNKKELAKGIAENMKPVLSKMGVNFISEGTTEVLQDAVLNKLNGNKMFDENTAETFFVSGTVGSIGGGISSTAQMFTPWSLGDATRVRKQNSNEDIVEIVQNSPVVAEDAEGKELMQDMLANPSEATTEAFNAHIFEEEETTAPPAEEGIDQKTKETAPTQEAHVQKTPESIHDKVDVYTKQAKTNISSQVTKDSTDRGKKPVQKTGEETRITVEADNLLREEFGIEPTKEPDTRGHAFLIQEAIESKRDINVLLDEIKTKPRPLDDFEFADIALEKARLSKSLRKNKKNLADAIESGNDAEIEKSAKEKKSLDKRLIEFTDLSRLAKTETGRALSAINLTLNKNKDLTDHVNDATAEKGGKLTDEQFEDIETAYDETIKVKEQIDEQTEGSEKSLDEKIAESRENAEQAKRTIKAPETEKEKSAKQKELAALKEVERDQDRIFELIKQLDEQTAKINDPAIKSDPERYKAIIENLLEMRSKSQWWKDLNESTSKPDKRRVKLLNDTLDNLQAQYDGKFRDVKTKKEDVSSDEIVDLKNKIAYLRAAMRLEDKISAIDEDIRLISEKRYDEVSKTKREQREANRDERLNALHTELATKRKRLETLKTDIGTGMGMKILEFQRAMKLSLDSWLLRQGGPSLKSNPFLTLDAWIKSFDGYSESRFYETQRVMESTQSYKDSKNKMGVVYNNIDAGFEEHQEAINSSLAEKIPPVRGSNRHMVLGVNLLRWNLSKRMLNRHPNESPEFYQAAGKWINDLTGRGGLAKLESSARGLTAFFTAPRYTTSKWGNITNLRRAWIEKDGKKEFNKDLAKEIAGQKARMYAGYAGMATALIAMGFEMGTDPEDPLFGKFRKGKVVIDIAPHMTAETRLIALYLEAFAANSLGIGELEGEYDVDMFNKTLRYAGYKVVPTFGTIMEMAEGETVVGEERNFLETLMLYPMPIMIEGMYQDLWKDAEEISDIITSQAAQFIGAGGGIYDDTEQAFERIGN